MTNLNVEEARLIAVFRAQRRFGEGDLVPTEDVSTLAAYFEGLSSLDKLEKLLSNKEMEIHLDGFIKGWAAQRLARAGLAPQTDDDNSEVQYQSGVDPITKEVRVPS